MALPDQTGVLNPWTNTIEPVNTGDWTDLGSTWGTSTTWNPTATSLVWISELIQTQETGTVNILVQTNAVGTVEYDIYASNTGTFTGEETVTSITQGQQGISAFSGRYFFVVATVTNTSNLPTLENMSITLRSKRGTKLTLNDIDTSELSGTTAARTVDFGRTVGGVSNMQITVKSVPDYTLDVYVTDYPTANTVIPRIVDKTVPSIALVGLDNVPRDGVVDITADILPEQYMSGNNLLVR